MAFELGKFLSNPDVLTWMAMTGAGLSGKDNPLGTAMGLATVQGLKSDAFKSLLQAVLGSGGKVTMDGQNLTVKTPVSALQQSQPSTSRITPTEQLMELNRQGSQLQTPQPQQQSGLGGLGILNPSIGLPDISGLSLASLKPEEIAEALKIGLAQEEIKRKAVSDLYQNKYWEELIKEKQAARLDKEQAPLKPTQDMIEYFYGKYDPEFVKWKDRNRVPDDPAMYRVFLAAKANPDFGAWFEKITQLQAGGRTVGQAEAKKSMYHASPELFNALTQYVGSTQYQNKLYQVSLPKEPEQLAALESKAKEAGYKSAAEYTRAKTAAELQRDFILSALTNQGIEVKAVKAKRGFWEFHLNVPGVGEVIQDYAIVK